MEYVLIISIGIGLGLLANGALLRLSGVERAKASAGSRQFDGQAIIDQITGILPISKEGERETLEALARSGVRMNPSELWASRFILGGVGLALGIFGSTQLEGLQAVAALPLGLISGLMLPQLYLMAERRGWRNDIEKALPNALDLLCISVSAGLTFDAGLRTVASKTTGALADSLKDVVSASRYMSTTQALKRLSDAADVKPLTIFVASLMEAERSGIPLVEILKTQAESVRTYRRQKVEEEINKLATKMVFPCLFIFCALLAVILAPALAHLVGSLGSIAAAS